MIGCFTRAFLYGLLLAFLLFVVRPAFACDDCVWNWYGDGNGRYWQECDDPHFGEQAGGEQGHTDRRD